MRAHNTPVHCQGEFYHRRSSRTLLILLLTSFLSSPAYACNQEHVEELHRTGKCYGGNFLEADFRGKSLNGKSLKGGNLEGADLRDVEFGDADLYNTNLKRVRLNDDKAFRAAFPLAGIPGRITRLKVGDQEVDLTKIPFSNLAAYEARAGQGDPRASFITAYLYETYGTRDQEALAFEHYTRAAETLPEARNNQAWMYENGRGTLRSLNRAKELYRQSAAHPTAVYNGTRWEAFYNPDEREKSHALFGLAKTYENGQGVERDKGEAFLYHSRAADLDHPEAQYAVADFYKNGRGVIQKDLHQAAKWCEKAAENGLVEAQFNTGSLYEDGIGVPQNYATAMRWFLAAAARDHAGAQRNAARLYELGRGVTQDYQAACDLYTKAARQGKRSAEYSAARMYEYLPRSPENNAKALALLFSAVKAEPSYPGALFLLATRYEQGRGIAINLEEARRLYQTAAAQGHLAARLKLMLMDAPVVDKQTLFLSMQKLEKEIQYRHIKAQERVLAALSNGHRILNYTLEEDYVSTQKALAAAPPQGEVVMNYAAISGDPYGNEYRDVHEEIRDEEANAAALDVFKNEMRDAFRTHPAYTAGLQDEFTRVISLLNPRENPTLVKRVIRLYRNLLNGPFIPIPEGVNPKAYRQGEIVLRFVQNYGRCIDGLTDYVDGQEWKTLYGHPGESEPLGYKISKILTKYKVKFLEQHRNPLVGAHEEATEASALLRQRMRIPLGLPGAFQQPAYPAIGKGDDEKYRPEKVMERFIRGGTLRFTRGDQYHEERIESYTPELMIQLLMQAQRDPQDKNLTNEHLNTFIEKDLSLREPFEKAFTDMERNDYFDPFAEASNVYLEKLFEYFLSVHGYVIKAAAEPAAASASAAAAN